MGQAGNDTDADYDRRSITYLKPWATSRSGAAKDRARAKMCSDIITWLDGETSLINRSKVQYLSHIVTWMKCNDIEFTPSQKMMIKEKAGKGKVLTRDHALSREDMQRILLHSDIKMRAIILTLATGGLRIGDLLRVTHDDVKRRQDDLTEIEFYNTKSDDEPMSCYITEEADQALMAWENHKPKYMLDHEYRHFKGHSADDKRLFPYTYGTINAQFLNVLKRAGLHDVDKRTNRSKITLHSLRKYCLTKLRSVNVDKAEEYIGHSGYLTTYRRYTVGEIKAFYKEAVHSLMITGLVIDNSEKISEVERENKLLRSRLEAVEDFIAANRLNTVMAPGPEDVIVQLKPERIIVDSRYKNQILKLMKDDIDTLYSRMGYTPIWDEWKIEVDSVTGLRQVTVPFDDVNGLRASMIFNDGWIRAREMEKSPKKKDKSLGVPYQIGLSVRKGIEDKRSR